MLAKDLPELCDSLATTQKNSRNVGANRGPNATPAAKEGGLVEWMTWKSS
jgi:hypothetical protein